jgi:putative NADPH-quinone reductase
MRVLVVYCHPCPESFNAAIRDKVLLALRDTGHQVHLTDLYAEGFDPVMSADERRGYHTPVENERPVADHLERLRWAEGLVIVYPTWWYGPPAMLKGWLDRVWLPHATFGMPEPGKPISRKLTNIRAILAISTLGSPWWWWTLGMMAPGRRMLLTGLGVLCHPLAKRRWLGLHEMDSADAARRDAFLNKVDRTIRALR